MADWDPFADPGDDSSVTQPIPVKVQVDEVKSRKTADDIFTAFKFLEAAETERVPVKLEEDRNFSAKLDALFSLPDDDMDQLRAAFAGVMALVAEDGSRHVRLWQRAIPSLEADVCSNLLGLLIDDSIGLSSDASGNPMNAVHVDVPSDGDSGQVVFLLAWGGGSLQDVQDMVDMYRGLFPGCTMFVSTSNRKQSFGLRCQCAVGIRAAAEAWSRSSQPPRLLVHLFSNSGLHAWTEILQAWQAVHACPDLEEMGVGIPHLPPLEDVLRGIILDSACDSAVPIDSCIQSFVQSIAGTVAVAASLNHDGSEEGKKNAEVAGKRAVASLIGGQSIVKSHLYGKPQKMLTKFANADTAIVHRLEPAVPMQFIYSKDDNIILAQGVERYLQEVAERPSRKGMSQPRVWRIEKSRHCFHKLTHRDEYRTCVQIFATSLM
mmetsp:Transcript_18982/g.35602  ORF Transcript_18982/g.35602 Transcript_18982/m.35602 type:complete len:434 (+) Transcript_18982:45-1346(+)